MYHPLPCQSELLKFTHLTRLPNLQVIHSAHRMNPTNTQLQPSSVGSIQGHPSVRKECPRTTGRTAVPSPCFHHDQSPPHYARPPYNAKRLPQGLPKPRDRRRQSSGQLHSQLGTRSTTVSARFSFASNSTKSSQSCPQSCTIRARPLPQRRRLHS